MTAPVDSPTAASTPPATHPDWRWQHVHAARSLDDVERLFPGRFELASLDGKAIAAAAERYGMRATPYYLDLARRAGPDDPIWALAVPDPRELARRDDERDDPIGDELPHTRPLAAITRRYEDRVLLHPTSSCSVHCRHCFRKRLVGRAEAVPDAAELSAAVDWIAGQRDLREVILTGGDPLTLSDERLLELLARLDALEHIVSLRLHSRMPVVNPFRVTEALAVGLGALTTPVLLVTHANHAREVTDAFRASVATLRAHGVDVLNQSVLLAGINDEPETHRELLFALMAARVRPYALHHADLVPGTAHRRTSVATGRELMAALRGRVPGWALPRYLLDVPGGHGKVPVEPEWARDAGGGQFELLAPDGTRSAYDGNAPG